MRRGKWLPALFWLITVGCGSYADFRFPRPGGTFGPVHLRWDRRTLVVLDRGRAGEWDAVDVLNPSVVLLRDGTLLNLYSGFDGKTWHTGVARSTNGLVWRKHGRVLSPHPATWEGGYIAANGTAIVSGEEILYWYQAGDPPRIGLARSIDTVNWLKHPEPVLGLGPRGSWDERGVADPYVVRAGAHLYLFYLGQDRARRQRLGLARSIDGQHWEKLRTNPILELGADGEFDENGLGEPAVWAAAGRWWMLYTGRDRREYRRLGLAWSRDGVRWQRLQPSAVFAGGEPWNAKVVCDPSVLDGAGGKLRMWYGGGDAAHPAENINGRIGYTELFLDTKAAR